MKVKDIASSIERLAPQALAYDWDNVGLLCGDMDQDVDRLLLTLDLDIGVVNEAVQKGVQLIVSHHPILFDPIQRITRQTPMGRLLYALIQNNISFYAAHTNLDIAKGGLNDLLAKKVGLKNVEILEYIVDHTEGIGRIGDLDQPVSLCTLAERIKKVLNVDFLRYSGDSEGMVSRIAVNTGGGTSLIPAAIASKADVLITGDYKYSQIRHCIEHDMKIIDVGHYDTEFIVCELFYDYLKHQIGSEIELLVTEANKNVVKFI